MYHFSNWHKMHPMFPCFQSTKYCYRTVLPKKKGNTNRIYGGSLCIDSSCMMLVGNKCTAEVSNGEKKFFGPILIASNRICISWNSHLVHFLLKFNLDFVGFQWFRQRYIHFFDIQTSKYFYSILVHLVFIAHTALHSPSSQKMFIAYCAVYWLKIYGRILNLWHIWSQIVHFTHSTSCIIIINRISISWSFQSYEEYKNVFSSLWFHACHSSFIIQMKSETNNNNVCSVLYDPY